MLLVMEQCWMVLSRFLGCVPSTIRSLHSKSTHLPTTTPKMQKLFPLSTRKLFQLKGSSVSPFLKRLTTRNIESLEPNRAVTSLILNSSGKILMDVLIWKQDPDNVICEVDRKLGKRFVKHVQKYALRQDVKVQPLEDWNVFVRSVEERGEDLKNVSSSKEGSSIATNLDDGRVQFVDPRHQNLGERIWTPSSAMEKDSSQLFAEQEIPQQLHQYYIERCLQGVPEGYHDLLWEKSVPWESNFDVHKGVDLGFCFMGQELTARSFHTGVFRRRMLAVRAVDDKNEFLDWNLGVASMPQSSVEKYLPKHGETIRAEGMKGRFSRMGRMGSSEGAVGLCLLKTKEARNPDLVFYGEESGRRFKAVLPDWLDEVEAARERRESL